MNLAKGWKLIASKLTIEDPAPSTIYLGCKHIYSHSKLSCGKSCCKVVYDMEDYLKSIVSSYKTCQTMGTDPKLRKVDTPFAVDDKSECKFKAPVEGELCINFDWRGHVFPAKSALRAEDSSDIRNLANADVSASGATPTTSTCLARAASGDS